MASINSLYGSSVNKGFGGLMSGLDTDELVKQMTAATRNKINRQYQAKQKLLYRQEAYREVSKKLLAFSDKYFSFAAGSKTNILSPSFFASNTFKSSSNYVNVTGNAENIKNFTINSITSVASSSTLVSSQTVSSGEFKTNVIPSYIASPLAGEKMTLEIDGNSYDIKFDNEFGLGVEVTAATVVDAINEQLKDGEGNQIFEFEFDAVDNKIVHKEGYEEKTIKLTAAGKKVTELLNLKVGQNAVSTEPIDSELNKSAESILKNSNEYITFIYNGVKKQIKLSEEITNASELATYLHDKLKSAYGADKINVIEENGELSFQVNGDTNILSISSISSDLSKLTGLKSGNSNRVDLNATLEESGIKDLSPDENGKYTITINDVTLSFEKDKTLNDVIKAINSNVDMKVDISYSSTTDTFSIKADETGSHININNIEGNLGLALFGDSSNWTSTPGKDTEITYTLNGQPTSVIRSTSNFTIDGINIELNKNAENLSNVTFEVTNNADDIVEKVKQFIDDYNEIITLIGAKTKEKPNTKYLPLTPDQQEEMKEKEIENWNKEAQKGALFGDSKMITLLSSLRTGMTGKTDVSELILSNIGITAASMDTSGKLVLDENKFKEKLLENPDEIANLFTGTKSDEGSKSGLAVQIRDILRKNIGAFGTSGILIEEAGLDSGRTSDQNFISKKIKEHDDKMESLKKALEVERQRYWNQFTALEKTLSKLNAQSSWLTDMMG